MTKDEILENETLTHCSVVEALEMYKKGAVGLTDVTDAIKPAMDEYAKQQAIAFDVWKLVNYITYDYANNAYSKLIFIDVDHTKVRTEQLSIDDTYSQFIEQQNKTHDRERNKSMGS